MVPAEGEANLISRRIPGRPARIAWARLLLVATARAWSDSRLLAVFRAAISLRLWARISSSTMGELRQPAKFYRGAAAVEGLPRHPGRLPECRRMARRPGQDPGVERDRVRLRRPSLSFEQLEQPGGILVRTRAGEQLHRSRGEPRFLGRDGDTADLSALEQDPGGGSVQSDFVQAAAVHHEGHFAPQQDRKSTRLNSSHLVISYAVFCL